MAPDGYDPVEAEANHLFYEADANKVWCPVPPSVVSSIASDEHVVLQAFQCHTSILSYSLNYTELDSQTFQDGLSN